MPIMPRPKRRWVILLNLHLHNLILNGFSLHNTSSSNDGSFTQGGTMLLHIHSRSLTFSTTNQSTTSQHNCPTSQLRVCLCHVRKWQMMHVDRGCGCNAVSYQDHLESVGLVPSLENRHAILNWRICRGLPQCRGGGEEGKRAGSTTGAAGVAWQQSRGDCNTFRIGNPFFFFLLPTRPVSSEQRVANGWDVPTMLSK